MTSVGLGRTLKRVRAIRNGLNLLFFAFQTWFFGWEILGWVTESSAIWGVFSVCGGTESPAGQANKAGEEGKANKSRGKAIDSGLLRIGLFARIPAYEARKLWALPYVCSL
jgi:hypothetical protein